MQKQSNCEQNEEIEKYRSRKHFNVNDMQVERKLEKRLKVDVWRNMP